MENRDLWWEARQRTAQYRGDLPERAYTWVTRSLPGLPTKTVPMQIISAGRGMGVDLNLYRKKVNVKMLFDLGVRIFDLRLFGPTYWWYDNWKYEQDETFEGYYQQLVDLPEAIIGAYGVYNPWLDEEAAYKSKIDPNVEYMKLYAKNYPGIHYHTWDVEVGTCTKGANKNNGITGTNLALGLSNTMNQTLREMPKFANGNPRIPELYSATWFLKQYGDPIKLFLEHANADPANPQFIQWLAWLPTVFNGTYTTPSELFDKVITPNGIQENAYLRIGAAQLAGKWQCTWTLKGPWSPDVGIDASLTYGPCAQLSQYKYLHNITAATPPPEPGTVDLVKLLADIETIRADEDAKIRALFSALK